MKLTIRKAEKVDCATILELIHEIAAYEKLSHEVTATRMELEENLFGKRAYAEVLLAEVSDRTVGYALFFHNFSTFLGKPGMYLEDLYVKPEFRGQGIGKRLLSEVASVAQERDCGRMEWVVIDWNEPAIAFYDQLGAESKGEWILRRLKKEDIGRIASP